jgi:hypothetical protein
MAEIGKETRKVGRKEPRDGCGAFRLGVVAGLAVVAGFAFGFVSPFELVDTSGDTAA